MEIDPEIDEEISYAATLPAKKDGNRPIDYTLQWGRNLTGFWTSLLRQNLIGFFLNWQ